MARQQDADLCVIGAGAAGLSVAAIASQVGVRVMLIERDRMGGECLNTGCVPSKALLAAAKAAHGVSSAAAMGIEASAQVDFKRVHAYVHSAIQAIAPHDSQERFEKLGVEVVRGDARFVDGNTLAVDGRHIRARRFVVATGSEPFVPSIPGLEEAGYCTNENIFDQDARPEHLIVLGGGPIGVEIGQAYRRLGAAVTILERDKALPKDDEELARPLLQRLRNEGVDIREGADVRRIKRNGDGVEVEVEVKDGQHESKIRGTHVLVATGRKPRLASLGLESAGIKYTDKGIIVDRHLQTTVRGIYAAGDVVDGPHFTHVCSYHAGIIVKNAVFRLSASVDYRSLPWVTYTDPELAQVGLTEDQARKHHGPSVRVVRVPFAANDRATTEGHGDGMLKLVAGPSGRVLGASILGANAGELAHLWVLAIEQKLKLRNIAQMIAPYPTWGELNKAAAAEFSKPLLSSRATRMAARILSWLP
jgi:pyruvate/2-oxoglutarate dehydrogenase complex dihydrolipoamide dehydrogenase (E3) component